MEQKRIEWIDRAKGIAIFLVLFGHMCIIVNITTVIYAFHMPLFFFLSGLVFQYEKYPGFLAFLRKKFKDLMIPCLLFNLMYILWRLVYMLSMDGDVDILKHFLGLIVQNRGTAYCCEAWFIPCIFCMEIMLYTLIRLSKNNQKVICLFSCIALIVGYVYCYLIHITLPWSVDAAIMALFFGGLGYCCKKLVEKIDGKYISLYLLLIPVALWNYHLSDNKRVEMWGNDYGNLILFVIGAFSGCVATIALSKQVKLKILEYYGKMTLFLYGMQLVFTEIFRMASWKYNLYKISTGYSIVMSVVLTILLLIIFPPFKKPYDKILHNIKEMIG